MERAATELESAADVYLIHQSIALDGLSFGLLDDDQARRVARVLARVSDELRVDLINAPSDDPRDAEFAEYLSVLEMLLHDVFE